MQASRNYLFVSVRFSAQQYVSRRQRTRDRDQKDYLRIAWTIVKTRENMPEIMLDWVRVGGI